MTQKKTHETAIESSKVLLVEDERSIALGIVYNLEKRGYVVEHADRGDRGLEAALSKDFDLVILDVMLPGKNGFEICRELRERGIHIPILMLTARAETNNRVKGIRLGADDYLAKPFDLEELLARVEALLRRRQWEKAPERRTTSVLLGGNVEFDIDLLELRNQSSDEKIALTAIECRLLELLVNERDRPVPRSQLLKKVWGLHEDTQTRTLDNFIMRLRQHLEVIGGSANWIESVRGVGYRFATPT